MAVDQYVISYPISGDKLINCAGLVSKPSMYGTIYEGPWVSPVTHEEMMAEFPDWEPQTAALLNVSIRGPLHILVHDHRPYLSANEESFTVGHQYCGWAANLCIGPCSVNWRCCECIACSYSMCLTLRSDPQAHAMLPHQAAGAGQGVEVSSQWFSCHTHTNRRPAFVACRTA